MHSTPVEKASITGHGEEKVQVHYEQQSEFASALGTIRSKVSKVLHIGHSDRHDLTTSEVAPSHSRISSISSASSNSSLEPSAAPTPMLDPSTNANPLELPDDMNRRRTQAGEEEQKKKKKRAGDVSKHTFYIENSQMRLKLFARNEASICILLFEKSSLITFVLAPNVAVDHCARESCCKLPFCWGK